MNIILLYSHLVSYYIYFAFKKETILSHHLPFALSATVLNILGPRVLEGLMKVINLSNIKCTFTHLIVCLSFQMILYSLKSI